MALAQENHFQTFCKLSQNVVKIQNQICTNEVDEQTRVGLHFELELIQNQIEEQMVGASNTSATFCQFEQMNQQIISLYREIEESVVDNEILLISKDALAIFKALEKGQTFKIAKQIEELRLNIHNLLKHSRPSLQHRKIVNLAMKLAYKADDLLANRGKPHIDRLAFIQKLSLLLKQATQKANLTIDPEEAELVMELCEIADLFETRRTGEGLMGLRLIQNQLSRAQSRRLEAASDDPKEMVQILHEIAAGDPCMEWDERDETESVIFLLEA